MKLAVDENVPLAISVPLQAAGIEVIHVATERPGRSDASNLEWAFDQQIAFLTFDDDYLRLAAAGDAHAGILFCHQLKYGVGGLAQALIDLAGQGSWPGPGEIAFV
ncbi:MAG: DUF5615 family PIN-like protein [Dehalococcoidia bacterium]